MDVICLIKTVLLKMSCEIQPDGSYIRVFTVYSCSVIGYTSHEFLHKNALLHAHMQSVKQEDRTAHEA